jgi:hypothetical protein
MKTVADIAAPGQAPVAPAPLRLLSQVRAQIRVLHYSFCTEQAYLNWIKRHIRFVDKRPLRRFRNCDGRAFMRGWMRSSSTANQLAAAHHASALCPDTHRRANAPWQARAKSAARALLQNGDRGQCLALEKLQKRAAGGRNVADLVGNPELVDRGDGVAAAGDRECR